MRNSIVFGLSGFALAGGLAVGSVFGLGFSSGASVKVRQIAGGPVICIPTNTDCGEIGSQQCTVNVLTTSGVVGARGYLSGCVFFLTGGQDFPSIFVPSVIPTQVIQ